MRVAINAIDSRIVIDGKHGTIDCAELLRSGISAVQWYDDHGEVEYLGHLKPNETIDDFTPFQSYVEGTEFLPETPPPTEIPPVEPPSNEPMPIFPGLSPNWQTILGHENRIRKLEGKKPLSEEGFKELLAEMMSDYISKARAHTG